LKIECTDAYGNIATQTYNIEYSPPVDEFETRKNKAILFAVCDYSNSAGWDNLNNPIKEAEKFALELVKYGFDTIIYRNPTLDKIYNTLFDEVKNSKKTYNQYDQLLVFYSGHGYYQEELERGYIVPSNGNDKDVRNTYLSYLDVSDLLNKMNYNHVLFISDACFSGTFFQNDYRTKGKSEELSLENIDNIKTRMKLKTRLYLGSAGKEESPDKSIFMQNMLSALQSNKGVITYEEILPYTTTSAQVTSHGAFGNFAFNCTFVFIKK
jgi:hypothetical protein